MLSVAISQYAATSYELYLGHENVLQISSSSVTLPICHDKCKWHLCKLGYQFHTSKLKLCRERNKHKKKAKVYFATTPYLQF